MSPLANHPYAKMNGLGNRIVVIDLRGADIDLSPGDARAIAHWPGLGFDQLMVLRRPVSPQAAAFMDIFNTDGSRSSACGNGTRCVAYLLTRGTDLVDLTLETAAGPLACVRDGEFEFTVDMGAPRLGWRDIPLRDAVEDTRVVKTSRTGLPDGLQAFSAVNMGNPHAVFFVDESLAGKIAQFGPQLETDPMFPEKANISFARVASSGAIQLRVWERGAGATLACGTAACATLVAAARAGLTDRTATVTLPGGDLRVHWRESDGHVLMSGPVELESEGRLNPAIFTGAEP